MDNIRQIADAVQKGLYIILRANVQQGSTSLRGLLALSCGLAKCQFCLTTVTVVVYRPCNRTVRFVACSPLNYLKSNKNHVPQTLILFYRTCKPSVSNVLSDFVSMPASANGGPDISPDGSTASKSFRHRSRSLITRVRRGLSEKKRSGRPRNSSQIESFNLSERKEKNRMEEDDEIGFRMISDKVCKFELFRYCWDVTVGDNGVLCCIVYSDGQK